VGEPLEQTIISVLCGRGMRKLINIAGKGLKVFLRIPG
jgi:hypothetical protein